MSDLDLEFGLNEQLDCDMALAMTKRKSSGHSFGTDLEHLSAHPGRPHSAPNPQSTRETVQTYHRVHGAEIRAALSQTETNWRVVETAFLNAASEAFGPSSRLSRIHCYISVLNVNPWFEDSRSFQVFYAKSPACRIHTVAHELTHFLFADCARSHGLSPAGPAFELAGEALVDCLLKGPFSGFLDFSQPCECNIYRTGVQELAATFRGEARTGRAMRIAAVDWLRSQQRERLAA